MKNLNKHATCLVGSRLYGIHNDDSDYDYIEVVSFADARDIFGLHCNISNASWSNKEFGNDVTVHEIRKFFALLKKGSTAPIEVLWAPAGAFSFTYMSYLFARIRGAAFNLTSRYALTKSISGFAIAEKRLALGERTGALGSKRKSMIDTYGFSPKNVANIVRLSALLKFFHKNDYISIVCSDYGSDYDLILNLRNHPELFSRQDVEKIIDLKIKETLELKADPADNNFDENLVDNFLKEAYFGDN